MSDQIFASSPLDVPSGRSNLAAKPAPRGMRSSTDPPAAPTRKWPLFSKTRPDRPAFGAASAAPAELGIFFHLVCVGAVATAIIAVFFGAGLYSLGNPTEELFSKSWAHRHAGLAPASPTEGASVGSAAAGADVPPLVAAPQGALAASMPDPVRLVATGTPRGQSSQPGAGDKALGAPSQPHPEPGQAQGDPHPDPKRLTNASTELVFGIVNEAPDAMTWVVDDQVVHLWGIRPGPRNLQPSLSSFVDWVRATGPVKCHKQAHSSRYQCFAATREDIAKAALLAGVGEASDGATPAYRDAEAQARRQGRGIWAKT